MRMEEIEDFFADLDEKMKHDWRLRWYYRWAKLRLDVSEWYWKHFKREKVNGTS